MSARGWTRPALVGLLFAALSGLGPPASAQDAAPEAPAAAPPAVEGEAPKPRPKRRPPAPRPAAKASPAKAPPAESKAESVPAAAPVEQGTPVPVGADQPVPKPAPAKPIVPKAVAPKPAIPKAAVPKTPRLQAPASAPSTPAAGLSVPSPVAPTLADPAPVPAPAATPPTPAALSPPPVVAAEPPSPCEARAALYDGEKGFSAFVTRIGRVQVENPLRPLTPEVTRVLQLSLAGKVATAYGPDLTALRRGGSPAVLESQLGGGIRWEPALPLLPETLTIVSEAGDVLARLAFRACTEAPAAKALPEARAKDRKLGARRPTAADAPPKAPPGFQMPQGAIAQ